MLPENLSEAKRAEIALILARPEIERAECYPVDFRITVPVFGRRLFLAVIAGPEKRNPDRLMIERERLPIITPGNLVVLFVVAVLVIVAIAAAGLFFAFFNGSLFAG